MDQPFTVVVNPSSGQGRGARFISELRRLLSEHALDARILVSSSEEHMRELFADLAKKERLLAAVGGDTTFTIMARELWRIRRETEKEVSEMAWIGVGSANDILRHVGLERPEAAVAAIKNGQTLDITLGEIRDENDSVEQFLGSVAFGAAPRVNQAIERSRSKGRKAALTTEWGPGLFTLKKAFGLGELPIDFELDPENGRGQSGTASLLLLLNMPHFSRGVLVNDFAALETQFIDWTVLSCDSLLSLWRMQRRLVRRRGEVIHEDIQYGQSRAGKLKLVTPQPYLIDGELKGPVRELSFSAIPRALKLRVPHQPEAERLEA